jgi:hypothetical protein
MSLPEPDGSNEYGFQSWADEEEGYEQQEENPDRVRIISKEGRRWKVVHSDGAVTYHKTKKAAQEYKHTLIVSWEVFADECA